MGDPKKRFGLRRLRSVGVAPRRQSRQDIRDLIAAVKAGGWTVDDPIGNSNVYKAKCHCGQHLEYIHSTPGKNYAKKKLAHMRSTCWNERQ